jgi:hypothetical protein
MYEFEKKDARLAATARDPGKAFIVIIKVCNGHNKALSLLSLP